MKTFQFTLFIISLLIPIISFAKKEKNIQISHFSSGDLDHWENKQFSGNTTYQITQLGNNKVLKAESHSSASGLFKRQRIDLQKTPYLNWRWRIENHLHNLNEQSKSGDDYSARIYIVIDGGWTFWKTKAINYVWASNSPKKSIWPNAYAGKNAMMIAVRSKIDKTHTWYTEKRNILEDLKEQFGSNIRYIDAVALMTDTDDSKSEAISFYDDIYFSAE
jgi:hypothetical protein